MKCIENDTLTQDIFNHLLSFSLTSATMVRTETLQGTIPLKEKLNRGAMDTMNRYVHSSGTKLQGYFNQKKKHEEKNAVEEENWRVIRQFYLR